MKLLPAAAIMLALLSLWAGSAAANDTVTVTLTADDVRKLLGLSTGLMETTLCEIAKDPSRFHKKRVRLQGGFGRDIVAGANVLSDPSCSVIIELAPSIERAESQSLTGTIEYILVFSGVNRIRFIPDASTSK